MTENLRERIAAEPLTGAWLSEEATPLYRYALWRFWQPTGRPLLVSMLNPSTADHRKDDDTITRVIQFAKRDGYAGIVVLNAYAFRSSQPKVMRSAGDPDGPLNRAVKLQAAELAAERSDGEATALMAHGNHGGDGALLTFRILRAAGCRTVCLGTTLGGHPKHPMARGLHRIPDDAPMLPWAPSEGA